MIRYYESILFVTIYCRSDFLQNNSLLRIVIEYSIASNMTTVLAKEYQVKSFINHGIVI